MNYRLRFVVIFWMVDHVSGRKANYAFHFHNGAACSIKTRRLQQQLFLGSGAADLLPLKTRSTKHPKNIQSQQRYKSSRIFDRPQQHYQTKFLLHAIHEPQSDVTPSHAISNWSPSLLLQSMRIKDRYQLSSIIRASIVVGLSSYYFYKGLYSINSAISFWNAEGDLILKPLSVATWSAELIGYVFNPTIKESLKRRTFLTHFNFHIATQTD